MFHLLNILQKREINGNKNRQHWQERFQVLQTTHDEQNKYFIDLKTQYAVLLQQSETMKIELNELHEQNKLLAHEKWILGQKKSQIYGQLKQWETRIEI